ncbi:class I SAM-dependent methyltransferase [Gordonibacter massiliensis (ex Traore et al. 2017)]|uniref:class I SAM-dependent methyltransferase n=1 Tax=Gordonibacter massiliensis (ex Traore et al. 2017) TaxID=1841863 RepID=UPI001C8B3713|nr:methyltransferase domain-containing protein [Gordonibacter massiliensis (ex Traore et al. 2017)]MBX9033908.1 methyltransferase domain-containing protein [Gordonibacter massiliensis (ex Traore et al. 2017)]
MDLLADSAYWVDAYRRADGDALGAKEDWDAKARGFAHKNRRSSYIDQLVDLLALEPGESVFDMGAGSGTLSIPLAQRGHAVVAVDFSTGMLDELAAGARKAGVEVAAFERSWQDDWTDLPCADVAVASRSLIADDLADVCAKLESKARSRVAVTMPGGETPAVDLRMLRAMGRPASEREQRRGFVAALNYLFASGRRPSVNHIAYPRRWHAPSFQKLLEAAESASRPRDGAERDALRRFVERHATVDAETGECVLDYEQSIVWSCMIWPVPEREARLSS